MPMKSRKKLNLIIFPVIIIIILAGYCILNSSQSGNDPIAKCFINSEEYILINPDGIDIYTPRDGEETAFKASDGRKIISGCTDDLNRDGALEILVVLADSVSEYGNELIIFSYNNTLDEVFRVAYKELNPWKVMTGDVDGDGVKEISLGVYKKSDFHPIMARRPFIYNWDGSELSPKWLGSRLSRPFEDYIFSDVDDDNMDEIVAIEILQDGEKALNSYKWKGFGFEELAESQKYSDISELMPKNYKNDLKTKFSAKVKRGSSIWMEVDFCYKENSLIEIEE
jgi:hypothetical protein